jgi:hypothetical protein
MSSTLQRWRIVAALIVGIGAGGLVVDVATTDDGNGHTHRTITVTLGGPGDKTVPAQPGPSVANAAAGIADHADARDETPPGLTSRQVEQRRQRLENLAQHDQFPTLAPDAAPTWPGCTARFVRNYSSRGGVAPRLLVAHYTVSRNTPGWGDVWAIVSLFDRASFQASSNFVIDAEGHCAYIVRTSDKAWTQAGGNPQSISIEFVAYGDEGHLSPAAIKRGGEVFARAGKLYGIPATRGAVSGCLASRAGIVQHADGGSCWGGHHDIQPFPLQPLITAAQKAGAPTVKINARDRGACKRAHAYRARRHHTKRGTRWQQVRAARLHRRGLRCAHGKPRQR